ncbi:MAG: histidine phosphatase family protein [Prevotellaceae bacterium]|jgi:2,3-bisphosphoglycerate-dependent phosphoglycerate mutase|nr:histidine phosphatase family protein [Prevotellaceae bacterium]
MKQLNNIFLMRHAYSAANEDLSLYQRMPDHAIPLSNRGHEQAVEAGRHFVRFLENTQLDLPKHDTRLWYSPYLRARQTKDELLNGMGSHTEIIKDCREHILLTEQNFGLFEGLTEEECALKYPEETRKFNLCTDYSGKFYAKPPNGESRYDVCVRVNQFFGTVVRDAEKYNSASNIFVVSHGTTLRAFTMMWLHHEVEWFERESNPANCSIRWIGRGSDGRFEDKGYIFEGF